VTLADGVKLLSLLGSVVLFYASYRNQRWQKIQARLDNRAVLHTRPPEATGVKAVTGLKAVPSRQPTQAQFDRAAAELAARPYFDRLAYQLLCVGFAITAVAALLDLYEAGSLKRLLGF
jgi:hypothetical protein